MQSLNKHVLKANHKYLLLTGIESADKLLNFLSDKKINYTHLEFSDHYNFKTSDIKKLIKTQKENNYFKYLLLTEKDYYRLSENHKKLLKQHFELICVQIEIDFIDNDKSNFNNQLLNLEKSKNKLK